ncbi:MAG: insulinase family protein [Candidatus Gastranaerophilales bacterium]|nr:insulinase family protein [Candidatus Gastranaerophilales bacterium]
MRKIFLTVVILFIGLISYAADYSVFKLDNGQNVVIKEVHDNPIVIIDTWIKTGSINETDENNGAAHFLEHLFFKGTSKHPAKEFDKILESKGAVTNAATSKDYTHYYILIPSQYFELALDLHSDMLLNPLIPRKELEKERKVVIEEIAKNNDKPYTVLYRNLIREFYKQHPYKRDVIGTKEVIETISREQILDFYNTWYTPENMTTVIIGDIDTQKALNSVKTKFNKASDANTKKTMPVYKIDKKPSSQIEKKEDMKIETGYILIGFKGCHPMTNKDSYALDVLATILGDGKSSRLYKEIKEQKQLVHSISAYHSSMKDDSIFYVSANYVTEDMNRLKKSIFDEIDKLAKNEITPEEIQKAKNIIERDTYYSRESVSNIASEIGYTVTLTNDMSYYKNYLDNISKVTAEDLKRAAKQYLDKDSAVISVILPSKEGKPQIQKQENKTYSAKVINSNKDTVKYELENGASLIITQNPSNDIIALEISSRGGNNLEKIPGIASVTAETLLKGTHKYKSQELSLLLEENGIKISPSARGDSFGIAAKFTKNEKDLALDILEEIITKASLDSYEIERVKADKLQAIKNQKNNPDSLAFDEFKTALWQNTPYGNTGKVLQNTVPSIQKEDIAEFYSDLFPAQNVVITINGNVDNQEFINYFSRILKNDNEPEINLSNYKSKYKDLTKNKTVKVSKDSQASWLLLGWLTDGVLNEKDWAALQVIDSILGTGMSSRLFTELRDEQGLAYQVGSSFSANVNKGVFALYIATNPENAETAKNGMLKEIETLKKEFVTDKELSEAKDKLLGNFVLSMETNMDKASTVNSIEISGRDYSLIEEYPQLINSVTLQDVIKTANKYFNNPYVFTVVGPEKSIEKL